MLQQCVPYRPIRTSGKTRIVPSSVISVLSTVVVSAVLCGCSISPSILDSGASPEITGSTVSSYRARGVIQPADIDDSDWEKLRGVANEASHDDMAGNPVGWKNDTTGSSGSIMAFSAPNDGRGKCRSFAATVQNVEGIQRYKGETCTANARYWKITRFELVDISS